MERIAKLSIFEQQYLFAFIQRSMDYSFANILSILFIVSMLLFISIIGVKITLSKYKAQEQDILKINNSNNSNQLPQ